jgi:hypothetical protein
MSKVFIMKHIRKAKRKRVIKTQLILIGLTAITLLIFAFYVWVAEQLGVLQFLVGFQLWNLSPLDTWLIIIVFPFGVFFYVTYYFIYKFKVMSVV